ncbi:thiC family protein, partial [Vibrio parahaemolyticus V-223/04]
QSCVRSAS